MKHSSPLNFSSSGVPQRPSIFSASSVSVTRRLDSSRGALRTKQRSWVSSSLQHDSLNDFGPTAEATLDETQASLTQQDEEQRQNAERQAKRLRQLQARETRQRTALLDDATREYDDIIALHSTYAAIAETCVALREARVAKQQQQTQQSQQWSLQLLADARSDLVAAESTSRRAITHAEAAVRETMAQLHAAEARGLDLHEGVFRLLHAEQVRRAFLLREEARGVEEMRIPGFISLPCVPTTAPLVSSSLYLQDGEDRAGGRGPRARPPQNHQHHTQHASRRALREVDKMDLMAAQRCPFVCAADCPYMPPRTRQLGRAWANARAEASGAPSRAVSATAASPHPQLRQEQRQRGGISEVGKQRVRYALSKQHLSETTAFLPSLRVGI